MRGLTTPSVHPARGLDAARLVEVRAHVEALHVARHAQEARLVTAGALARHADLEASMSQRPALARR